MAVISAKKSTIVRACLLMRTRCFALALAEREAPRAGARLAVRMWMTIPPGPSTRPQLTSPGARVVLGSGVVAESWGAGPAVYLMHGWAGYRGQLGAFVSPLTEAGFRVIAIDAPGHGESGPGRFGRGRALMPDFVSALKDAIARYGPPHGVVAHSLGASAVAVATLDGLDTSRLVLIAPVSNVMSGIDIFSRMAGIGPAVRTHMRHRIERVTRMAASHFDIAARAAEREDLPPALVIHDATDKVSPFDNGALVAAAWPGARLETTRGLGHNRILSDPGIISTTVAFLARQQSLTGQTAGG
jgi:pimeloyl-ACP methyl ester carboxylesterase